MRIFSAMARAVPLVLACGLAACTFDAGKVAGWERVALLDGRVVLTAEARELPITQTVAQGRDYALCLLLASGVGPGEQEMRNGLDARLHGAHPVAIASGPGGVYRFSTIHPSWTAEEGSGGMRGSLEACLSPEAGALSAGTVLDSISVRSDVALEVFGVDWVGVPSK